MSVPTFSARDHSANFAAGALCCTLSHGAFVPVDVVKTRMQIEPALKGKAMMTVGRDIVAKEGIKGLATGFGATAIGYLAQGGAKFAGYEYWKARGVDFVGGYENAVANRTAIYLGAAAIAEFFADILLTPLEATRIRMVSDRTYATNMATGFMRMAREGGLTELYAGFIPILFKQIPYALGQFTVNEWAHEVVYKRMSAERKANLTPTENLGITLGCGVTAGIAAAVLSHPADTLLSKINQGKGGSGGVLKRLGTLAAEAGPAGLFAGLGPRIVMTAGLVSSQFVLYKYIKTALGAEKSVEIHKD
ncbi:mitochondrial phosphate carrier protein [Microbotryomycetes sp. JL201]|nr:mitochondrial phosphate carrier protein [Microbotryomycetes sp. JL201]